MPDATTTQSESTLTALGICLEEYDYPYPVQFFSVSSDLQQLRMAYMDVRPKTASNGKTVVLFHGKAFGCYYFHNVIEALTEAGYRVVAPDQSLDRGHDHNALHADEPREGDAPGPRRSTRADRLPGRHPAAVRGDAL